MLKLINSIGKPFGRDTKRKVKLMLPMSIQVMFQADNILLSFPKCGRSWVRLMIFDLVKHHYGLSNDVSLIDNELYKINADLKPISFSHDDEPMFKKPGEIHRNKSIYKNKNVLFLVRNPIDTAISWYFQVVKRGSIKWFKHNVKTEEPKDFIFNETGGLKAIVEYFNIWYAQKDQPKKFKILSYEEVRLKPKESLKEIMNFFEMENIFSEEDYDFAVANNDFKNVKKREANNQYDGETFKTQTPDDPDSYKARKAKVKGYLDYLDEEQTEFAESYVESNLNKAYKY